jgi:hypothetical protein
MIEDFVLHIWFIARLAKSEEGIVTCLVSNYGWSPLWLPKKKKKILKMTLERSSKLSRKFLLLMGQNLTLVTIRSEDGHW